MSETEAKVEDTTALKARVGRLEMQVEWLHRVLQHGILGGMELPGTVPDKSGDGSEGPL